MLVASQREPTCAGGRLSMVRRACTPRGDLREIQCPESAESRRPKARSRVRMGIDPRKPSDCSTRRASRDSVGMLRVHAGNGLIITMLLSMHHDAIFDACVRQ